MQAKANPPRMRRVSLDSGLAWAAPASISSELYAVCSHAIAMSMQLHPHGGYTASQQWLVVDGCRRGRNASQGELTAYGAR